MTLNLPFEQFAHVLQGHYGVSRAFIERCNVGVLLTAAIPDGRYIIACRCLRSEAEVRADLLAADIELIEGRWSLSDPCEEISAALEETFVAAIAFKSNESKPGIWVDAFPSLPSQVQAIRAMYDEFRQTGESPEVSFEEFVRLAEPNVVILSPADLESFRVQKSSRS